MTHRGLYFEDYEIGTVSLTQGRTITETDIVNFAGLSGDFNPLHTDAHAAAADTYGQRIAHGMLIQSIATGLATLTGMLDGTVLAFRESQAKFSLPVHIGDTIHVRLEVKEKKENRRLNAGNITIKFNVLNQENKTVQRGEWVMLIKYRPVETA